MIQNKIFSILQQVKNDVPDDFSTDLLNSGVFDSFDIVEVIGIIENTFSIEFDADDLLPENFCSVNNLANLVSKYINRPDC